MKPQVEILAPAGSVESMVAAINAGADAVYMGGSRFGARAYADNPQEDDFLRAIDYVHLHGRKLYMTVNTLIKEGEMEQLPGFLRPCYRQGLDAAIVQDLGVFSLIREYFPDLPVHASTQMTVTGYRFARLLKEMGASRVVTARELSLEEIARIGAQVDIEIESFVHGALCYCYSGQCLLSSLIGGRSGNRGRCAQPCRLPYRAESTERDENRKNPKGTGRINNEEYLMNLKDLCTLDLLPDILEAGVYSLKIEGRMKSPRYTAGVVHIYRKYVDRYLAEGREGYHVDRQDKKILLELFDRGGFTDGYYKKHNKRDMISLGKKPAFRQVDQELFDYLDREYVKKKLQRPVKARLVVREGEPVVMELEAAFRENGDICRVCVSGAVAQTAKNQPVTREGLLKQIHKTGESPFYFSEVKTEITGNCFVPVQELNKLRRDGLDILEKRLLEPYRRKEPGGEKVPGTVRNVGKASGPSRKNMQTKAGAGPGPRLHVSLEEPAGLTTVLACPDVDEVCLDACGFGAEGWKKAAEECRKAGKACSLILPHIFRQKSEQYFVKHIRELKEAGFDELILRSLEEAGFLREQGIELPWVFDANLYGTNRRACAVMEGIGAARLTFPVELNGKELAELTNPSGELIAYGHLPVMVSAQCIRQTVRGCREQPEVMFIRDRTGKRLPVRNHCRFCYNTVYNPDPLSLLGLEGAVEQLKPAVLRLSFTVEQPGEIHAVLNAYGDHFRRGKNTPAPFEAFTRGHFKRGIE